MLVIVILFGLIAGSFLTAVQNRLDHLGSILYDRSRCPKCNHVLGFWDLFPILSYLFLGGRCRWCGKKISILYPLTELITVGLALFVWYFYGLNFSTFILFAALWVLLLAVICDIKTQEVDDWVFAAAIALVVIWRGFNRSNADFFDLMLGGVIATILPFCLAFFSREKWMGYGDSFFAFFLGALCGFPAATVGLFAAFLLGSIFGIIVLIINGKKGLKIRVPFGPFLAMGSLIGLIWGTQIFDAYLKILGF